MGRPQTLLTRQGRVWGQNKTLDTVTVSCTSISDRETMVVLQASEVSRNSLHTGAVSAHRSLLPVKNKCAAIQVANSEDEKIPLVSYPGHMGPLFPLPCGLGMRLGFLTKRTHTARYIVLVYSTLYLYTSHNSMTWPNTSKVLDCVRKERLENPNIFVMLAKFSMAL